MKIPSYEELAQGGDRRESKVSLTQEGYDFLISTDKGWRSLRTSLPNEEILDISFLLDDPINLPIFGPKGAYVTVFISLESPKDGLPRTDLATINYDTKELKKTQAAIFTPIVEAACRAVRAFCLTRYHIPTAEETERKSNVQQERAVKTQEILDRYRAAKRDDEPEENQAIEDHEQGEVK
jgi:hypothetical protein